ncbi:MAG: ABC transporter permease [Verrucomicrobia bacterium]|nr:ABC transporter permease [Verrucomicrobiota bacterium]MBS0645698.1 ABC transporter permease [Verrucomicrobiota bacterium]
MVSVSSLFSCLGGLCLGIILYQTQKEERCFYRWVYRLLSLIVNIGRSIPFAILIVALIPWTRWLVGTSIGTTAAIVPLTIAAIPFFARVVETALNQVDTKIVQAAVIMGSTRWQIVTKVLVPESLPALVQGMTLTIVVLISYSALAGLVGGGGLGKLAIQYGYQRFDGTMMGVTLLLLLGLVEAVQGLGHRLTHCILRKRGMS